MTRTGLTCILKTQAHSSHAFWLIGLFSNAAWQYVKRSLPECKATHAKPSPRLVSRGVFPCCHDCSFKVKKHFQQVCRTPPQFLPYIGTRVRALEGIRCYRYLGYCSSHDIIAEGLEGAGLYVIKLETGAYQTVYQIPALPSAARGVPSLWAVMPAGAALPNRGSQTTRSNWYLIRSTVRGGETRKGSRYIYTPFRRKNIVPHSWCKVTSITHPL